MIKNILLPLFLFIILASWMGPGTFDIAFENKKITIESYNKDYKDVKNGHHKEYKLLLIENKTANKIAVTYTTEVYYNNKCYSCSNPKEYTFTKIIEAKSAIKTDAKAREKGLAIYAKMLDGVKASSLTKFEIKNVKVKTIK